MRNKTAKKLRRLAKQEGEAHIERARYKNIKHAYNIIARSGQPELKPMLNFRAHGTL